MHAVGRLTGLAGWMIKLVKVKLLAFTELSPGITFARTDACDMSDRIVRLRGRLKAGSGKSSHSPSSLLSPSARLISMRGTWSDGVNP
jgi:hypothetical protein